MIYVNMKNRESEILFRENYTKQDWEQDYPLLDSFSQLFPPEKIEEKQDLWIKNINNDEITNEKRQRRMILIVAEYINPEYMKTVPKGKLVKYLASIPQGKLNKIKMTIKELIRR